MLAPCCRCPWSLWPCQHELRQRLQRSSGAAHGPQTQHKDAACIVGAPGSGSPGANCSRCVFALPWARRAPTPRGAHCGRTLGHPQHARHLYFALQLQALRCATCAPSSGCWRARCPIARAHRRGHATAGPSRARREPGTPQPCTRACGGTLNRETCLLAGCSPPAPRDGRPQAALTLRIALDLRPTAGNPFFRFTYPLQPLLAILLRDNSLGPDRQVARLTSLFAVLGQIL